MLQVALRAIVSSLAHDSGLVKEVREAFEELEHGHTGSVKNATLLQVCPLLFRAAEVLLCCQAVLSCNMVTKNAALLQVRVCFIAMAGTKCCSVVEQVLRWNMVTQAAHRPRTPLPSRSDLCSLGLLKHRITKDIKENRNNLPKICSLTWS